MSSAGIAAESNATRLGIQTDASHARAPAPVNPTRPDPKTLATVERLPNVPSLPTGNGSLTSNQQRASVLAREIVYEADAIFTAHHRQAKLLAEYRELES